MSYYKDLAIAEEDIEKIIRDYEDNKHFTNAKRNPPAVACDAQHTVSRCVISLTNYLRQNHEDIIPLIVGQYPSMNEDLGELFQLISQECIRRRDAKLNWKIKKPDRSK